MSIGEQIRKRRLELNLTQEELATKMGYKTKSSINKIEIGINDIPQSKIVAFAKALDTTPSYLMGWDVEKENEEFKKEQFERIKNYVEMMQKMTDKEKEFMVFYVSLPEEKQEQLQQLAVIAGIGK